VLCGERAVSPWIFFRINLLKFYKIMCCLSIRNTMSGEDLGRLPKCNPCVSLLSESAVYTLRVSSGKDRAHNGKPDKKGLTMEKTLKILIIALMIVTGLQIVAVNFRYRSIDSIALQNTADWSAMQTAVNLMPLLP
jgi:hypothetical protein